MINYIRNEFKSILQKSEWMDEISKEKALAKVILVKKQLKKQIE
jgi:hypothetical protein